MSTQYLPRLRVKVGEPIGNEVFFAFPEIYDNEKTFLDADVASGASSITANGVNFAVDQYVIIGRPGVEKTEIIKLHGSTAPTSTTITFATNTVFAHNRGDIVLFIPYNQIVCERSVDAGVTFTPLSAIDLRVDSMESYLQRPSDASTDIYKFRFYNSTSTNYSEYSDQATASGYADNTVYSIKKRALKSLGEEKNSLITDEFLNDSLMEARRLVDKDPRILRWSFRTKFDTDVGTIIPGQYSFTVPTDLRDRNTQKNILQLRLGRQSCPCYYQDNFRFRQNYRNVPHTTLNGAVAIGDPTITLTSSGDFYESGNITIAAEAVSGTLDIVAYTANDESTNVLSGVTGIVAAGHSTAVDVWQNATFGLPSAYTIYSGKIYFDIPFGDTYAGENIYMDYYQDIQPVTSDSDVLDEPVYDGYVSYLRWKIKYLKSNGATGKDDDDYKDFVSFTDNLVTQELSGQYLRFVPIVGNYYGSNRYF